MSLSIGGTGKGKARVRNVNTNPLAAQEAAQSGLPCSGDGPVTPTGTKLGQIKELKTGQAD